MAKHPARPSGKTSVPTGGVKNLPKNPKGQPTR